MKSPNQRQSPLYVIAASIALLISFSQFNLIEILRLDRFQHTFFCATLVVGFYLVMNLKSASQLMMILSFVIFVGFFKELSDPEFDSLDMLANLVGIALGLILSTVSHFKPLGQRTARKSLNFRPA